jgi:hypothetical protein
MKRLCVGLLVLAVLVCAGTGDAARSGGVICVGPGKGCAPDLSGAVVSASDGDTIRLGAGTFAGGVTIAKTIHLVGAGAGM